MPPESILYHILFLSTTYASVAYNPFWGVVGYLITYHINATSYWWAISALRYSVLCYLSTISGLVIHKNKVEYRNFLETQEILLLLYLFIILISIPLSPQFHQGEDFAEKMTKVILMILIASHVITDFRRYRIYIWVSIFTCLFLGHQMLNAPDWMYHQGRFDAGIGGTDFNEGNFLAIHFGIWLPFIGIMFIKKGTWKVKAILLVAGAFSANSIAQVKSRGSFLALVVGALVAFLFPRPIKRSTILILIGVVLVAFLSVTDDAFWDRMNTVKTNEDEMDAASVGRIIAWRGAMKMAYDYPYGVGVGNFSSHLGQYVPEQAGRDTHSTYLRCLAELGVQGLTVLCLLVINAFLILRKIRKSISILPNKEDFIQYIFAIRVALAIHCFGSITITHTYIEDFYWLLMHPVFLKRVADTELKIFRNSQNNHSK